MDTDGKAKLRSLRADFEEVTGKDFSHFYCPLLFRDQDAELCRAHIVNEAFSSVGRQWIVQRKDVDGFYGRCFESDFVDIQYHGQVSAVTSMVDKALGKKFRPQILVRGHSVPYYYPPEAAPPVEGHSKVHLEGDQRTVEVHLKLTPEELETTDADDLEIRVESDLRLPALVSLIKVAHLTLFSMLGYRYALSAGGHFIGRSVLGEFYLQNYHLDKKTVVEKAQTYFEEFANLVRPVVSHTPRLEGTVSDNHLYVCETTSRLPWAFVVFARTTNALHAIVVPIFEHPDAISRFMSFLRSDGGRIEGRFCRYEDGVFKVWPNLTTLSWPPGGYK